MATDPSRVRGVFQAVVRLDGADRDDYLVEACAGEPDLRRRVEALLDAHDRAGDFLERSPVGPGLPTPRPADTLAPPAGPPGAGTWCGPYRLAAVIAEGGMGTVWRAEQEAPVRRTVALKVVRPGLGTSAILDRFAAERQALALMDHPNIAKVLDAGDANGQPFFVMELVDGAPIARFCRDRGLDLPARLRLFVDVCRAVQHAHQKGVIHRDLKPSNVLVTEIDGKPVPKVIDFGIAKALHDPQTGEGPVTGFGSVVGTPEYMSPEQADPLGLDVDTRSDVYSLGVLLYELLTGTTPLGPTAGRGDALRRGGEEPPPPSTRAASPAWARRLRGDLDWITLKALERDRERRYGTADALAADVLRHLADEPVLARPPSAAYRLRKFVRKNRGPVAAAALTFAALAAGVAGTTAGMVRARAAEAEAVAARAAETEQLRETQSQRDLARANAETARAAETAARASEAAARESEASAKAVLQFVLDHVFAAGRPKGIENGLGPGVTLRQAIDATEPAIGPAFADRPLVAAAVREVLGSTYQYLGDPQRAALQHEQVLKIRTERLGPNDRLTLTAMNNLGEAYRNGRRYDDALRVLEDALERSRTMAGPDDPDTITVMNNLGMAYCYTVRLPDGIRMLERVLAWSRENLGDDHRRTLTTANNLGTAYCRARRAADAVAMLEETLRRCEGSEVAEHPVALATRNNLGDAYAAAGRLADAAREFRAVLDRAPARLGADHPHVLATTFNLAEAYRRLGRTDDALPLHEAALAGRLRALPRTADDVFHSLRATADLYTTLDRETDARRLILDRIERARVRFAADPSALTRELGRAGADLLGARQFADAERVLREALAVREAADPGGMFTANLRSLLGAALAGQQKYAEAEPLVVAGYEGMRRHAAQIRPEDRWTLDQAGRRVVDVYDAWGRPAEAAAWRARLGLPARDVAPPPRPARPGFARPTSPATTLAPDRGSR
jgi:serine/threonine protein kinase